MFLLLSSEPTADTTQDQARANTTQNAVEPIRGPEAWPTRLVTATSAVGLDNESEAGATVGWSPGALVGDVAPCRTGVPEWVNDLEYDGEAQITFSVSGCDQGVHGCHAAEAMVFLGAGDTFEELSELEFVQPLLGNEARHAGIRTSLRITQGRDLEGHVGVGVGDIAEDREVEGDCLTRLSADRLLGVGGSGVLPDEM